MTDKRHLTPVPSLETLAARAEHSHEQGDISLNQARERSGLPISEHTPDQSGALPGHINSIGHETTVSTVGLELVTEEHVPPTGVKREAKLRKPRKARSSREKQAADQAPERHRVTPQGHDPYITVREGGRA